MATIETKLLRCAGLLPPELDADALYRGCEDTFLGGYHDDETLGVFRHGMRTVCNVLGQRGVVDLGRRHKAFSVALKLDEWERARDAEWGQAWITWARCVAFPGYRDGDPPTDMAARLTHIGQDHAIRRALGWEVRPGTLAVLANDPHDSHGLWVFTCPIGGNESNHLLPGVTGPIAARAAIYGELCNA